MTDTASLTASARRCETGPLTPAGLQDKRVLARRRMTMIAVSAVTLALLGSGVWNVFAAGGMSAADWTIFLCFLVGAPWVVMGVWNAALGLWLMHGPRDGLARAAPHLAAGDGAAPPASDVALAMTLRNEAPERALARLAAMRADLDASGCGHLFEIHVLSDSSDPAILAEEERLFARMRESLGGRRAQYRRRARNTGFKAGNIREFVTRCAGRYRFFLPLDSDSLMDAATILRMVRIMEAHPRIGILQSLVVGRPADSAFARLFQFGMRHGMRSFTMGAAWWQGDCGPFWGHNALVRMDAFRRHCRLPRLPGRGPLAGHILSHDQVEAALMRRAGYEVRVMPVETASFEDNPPTLADFTKRDLRWCQGNMQYWPILGWRGLRATSRFQILAAIMMYLGAPAWMGMTAAAAWKMATGEGGIDVALGMAMFFVMIAVSLVPKLLGLLDIALTPGGAARYGGRGRFALSGAVEIVFGMLLAPVVAFRVTLFLIGLLAGRSVTWGGQRREAHALSWGEAARGLWPQTLAGLALGGAAVALLGWQTALWAAPMVAGLALSIPFAVLTADPRIGRLARRTGLCAVPEDIAPPDILGAFEAPVPPTRRPRAA